MIMYAILQEFDASGERVPRYYRAPTGLVGTRQQHCACTWDTMPLKAEMLNYLYLLKIEHS